MFERKVVVGMKSVVHVELETGDTINPNPWPSIGPPPANFLPAKQITPRHAPPRHFWAGSWQARSISSCFMSLLYLASSMELSVVPPVKRMNGERWCTYYHSGGGMYWEEARLFSGPSDDSRLSPSRLFAGATAAAAAGRKD